MEQKQASVPVSSFADYDFVAFKSSELNVLLCYDDFFFAMSTGPAQVKNQNV
jgi:hypothetical protein